MPKFITIKRLNNTITFVRSELESATENPLTNHEEIINELYQKLNNILICCPECGERLYHGISDDIINQTNI